MLGENSLEGLMFSLAEIADPEILASYDWNSDFGVFQDSAPKTFFCPGEDNFLRHIEPRSEPVLTLSVHLGHRCWP